LRIENPNIIQKKKPYLYYISGCGLSLYMRKKALLLQNLAAIGSVA